MTGERQVDIRLLRWTDHNRVKLSEHGISDAEVEEILNRDEWVPAANDAYPNQVRMIGLTFAGRLLTIVLEPTPKQGIWRPITGWDAAPAEVAYYWEER